VSDRQDELRTKGVKLSIDIVRIEQKCHRLGLHVTGHAINKAVQQIGWELAEKLERIDEQQGGGK